MANRVTLPLGLVREASEVAVRKDLLGYALKNSPAHRIRCLARWPCASTFDRAKSLPAGRIQLGQMVEHLGIAPSIPAWKVLADGHQRVSLNTDARKMESRAGVTPA